MEFKDGKIVNQICASIVDPTTGDAAIVNDSGQLHTVMRGKQDSGNSTTIPLLADEVFTGLSIDTLDYSAISIVVNSDADSDIDGLMVQYSSDEITWHEGESFTIKASATKFFTPTLQARYVRVIYTNGTSDQTEFHMHTVLRKTPIKWSSHNIEEPIKDEDDAELVKAVITGKKANGDYDNVSLTNGGNMKVSLEELESGISTNSNSQLKTSLYDEGGIPAEIDNSTHSIQTIEYEHHEIHSGSHYNYCDYNLNVSNGTTIEFTLQTADTDKLPHLTFSFSASEGATMELYSSPTGISGGTAIIPRNNRTDSLNVSGVTLLLNPTITTDGTRAAGYLAGGGRTAGNASRSNELVLSRNTSYLVRITSLAVSNDISWCAEWYEHTDRN